MCRSASTLQHGCLPIVGLLRSNRKWLDTAIEKARTMPVGSTIHASDQSPARAHSAPSSVANKCARWVARRLCACT